MKDRKQAGTRLAAAALVLIMLIGCGGCSQGMIRIDYSDSKIHVDSSPDAILDYVGYSLTSNELSTQNVLYSQSGAESQVLCNLYDGLVTHDTDGNLTPCLAESWESEDGGLTWTFHLRRDAVWVDVYGKKQADLTAEDFVTGLEWVLNAAKNEGNNSQMPMEYIRGAREYFTLTSASKDSSSQAEMMEQFREMVGIETPDPYTVIYHCAKTCSFFPTIAVHCCLYPAPTGLIETLGVERYRALNQFDAWYSGPYIMTSYIQGNEKILDPNPLWWGNDQYTRFRSVTVRMVDDANIAYQLYQTGEVDQVTLSESALASIISDPDHRYYRYVSSVTDITPMYILFNYHKRLSDGSEDENWNRAVASEAFRKAWYYGLDYEDYLRSISRIDPLSIEWNGISIPGLVTDSDGVDYTELVRKKLGIGEPDGESLTRLDRDIFQTLKKQAMEELKAQGVSFPIQADYYVRASDQTALDQAIVLKQCISDSLGDDFVIMNIKTFVTSLNQEVVAARLQSFSINGWIADYGDPDSFLAQFEYKGPNAYYSNANLALNDLAEMDPLPDYDRELIEDLEEYTARYRTSAEITDDQDQRLEAMADAEVCFIEHALCIPLYRKVTWELSHALDSSKIHAGYSCQIYRYLNWKTNKKGFVSDLMQAGEGNG